MMGTDSLLLMSSRSEKCIIIQGESGGDSYMVEDTMLDRNSQFVVYHRQTESGGYSYTKHEEIKTLHFFFFSYLRKVCD
jgi:hypothetical protein